MNRIEPTATRRRSQRPRGGERGAALLGALLLVIGLSACTGPDPSPPPNEAPAGEVALALEPVADGFVRPLGVVAHGGRLYVLEQGGTVRIVDGDGTVRAAPFLDLTGHDFVFPDGEPETSRDERGLLGMAFRPGATDEVFVHYNDAAGDTVVSRMAVVSDPDAGGGPVADPAGEEEILFVDQPDGSTSHRGGQLAFGPDGMLYVALGDGGTGGDPARLPTDPLGSILRLDVDRPEADFVPGDGANPFANDPLAGDPRVWHYGLRNPWRFSFDDPGPAAGAGGEATMWIADVGEDRVEEVNRVPAEEGGHDFGWNLLEGDLCFPDAPCDDAGTTEPFLTYRHDDGRKSVTGGYVYRGEAIPSLQGSYLFGDFVDGAVRSVDAGAAAGTSPTVRVQTGAHVSSLGLDPAGELLVVDYGAGRVDRIVSD